MYCTVKLEDENSVITGTMGLLGNLTCGEILEQLMHAKAVAYFRNVVFMVS